MMRLSRLADYAIVIMSEIAKAENGRVCTSREIAERSGLTSATVSKILKTLAKAELVSSTRGARGGYQLAKGASDITVLAMVEAIDGPVNMTECLTDDAACELQDSCTTRCHWGHINVSIINSLAALSLADMCKPAAQGAPPIKVAGIGVP